MNEFKCEYGAINMIKYQFEIPICFWFQLMSLSNLFLKFGTFMVLYLGCVLYLDIQEKKFPRNFQEFPRVLNK